MSAEQPAPSALEESVIPSTIGVVVRRTPAGVVIAAVGKDAPAAGVRVGDLVLRYNGVAVTEVRQFNRLMLESAPGTLARLEVVRDGTVHRLEVPVEQIDTTPRV